MEITCPYPDIKIPNVSLPKFILGQVKSFSDKVAFVDDKTGRTMTFGEFSDQVTKLARSLHVIGFQKNDVVALCLPNMMEYAIIFYGVQLAGGIVAGLAVSSSAALKKIIANARPRYIFTTLPQFMLVNGLSSSCSSLQEIFTVQGKTDDVRSYEELIQLGRDTELPDVSIDPGQDTAILIYTSGTTGERKGTMHTHRSLVANLLQVSAPRFAFYSGNDVTIAIQSVAHGYGLHMYILSGLYHGCTSVFLEDYGLESLIKAVEKYKATFLALTPMDVSQLGKLPNVTDYDLSSLKTVLCSGGTLSLAVLERFKSALQVEDVRNAFGMSEAMMVLMPEAGKPSFGVGKPLPNNRIKIVDIATGNALGPGKSGELWIKGPSTFIRYKDKCEETDNVFVGEWMKSGDVAYFDDDLNVYITDRINDLIMFDVNKVSPSFIEEVIQNVPGVASVVAVGVAHEDYGEVPKAFVVKEPGYSLTEDNIKEAVQATGEEDMMLRGGVEFVDSLPKGPTGKVLRRLVKEMFSNKNLI